MKKEERYLKIMYYQRNNKRRVQTEGSTTQQNIIITPPDKALMVVVLFLVVIGVMVIFSASAPKCVDMGVNPAKFALQQIFGVIVGYLGLRFLSNYDYRKLVNVTNMYATIVILLLVAVHLFGDIVNGAQRWINLGPLSLQPSEFAKPAVVMLLAKVFHKDANITDPNKWTTAFFPILIMVGLIFVQPNLSMVILLGMTSVILYLCSSGSIKLIGMMAATVVPVLLLHGLKGYQSSRITTWLHPESDPLGAGYNIIQSLVAFASGGLYGVGFGASKQKLAWLPEAHTDFIFAVVGEELGFVGCVLVLILFWTLLQRGFVIASRCPDMYGKLLAVGLTFSICFQAFLNMSVASSFLPATGVPMPFISYGGSSVMVSLWMIGILLNISKKRVKKIRVQQNVEY